MSTVVKTEDASGQTIVSSVPSPVPACTGNLAHQGIPAKVTHVPEATDKKSFPAQASITLPSPAATESAPLSASGKATKLKKKKVTVTMATAATAQSSGQGAQGENTGRWTAEEHRLFLQGLEQHGKGWKKIASLIKSRTVVQIRTHAQKYFQKLQKARQNGEEGDVSMEGRGNTAAFVPVSASTAHCNKRRRQTSGTKRKSIQSVVSSSQRHGKKLTISQAASKAPCSSPPLPTVAPPLSHFVVPEPQILPSSPQASSASFSASSGSVSAIATSQGVVSGPTLEDSLFRFLTPAPFTQTEPQVNEVARQAGANPIVLPTDQPSPTPSGLGGDSSPTGVNELSAYPSWTDAKETPSWYTEGSDVDALLDVADTLDWLTDSGDLNETYEAASAAASSLAESEAQALAPDGGLYDPVAPPHVLSHTSSANISLNTLPHVDSSVDDVVVPPLPSLFDGFAEMEEPNKKMNLSRLTETTSTGTIEEHLHVFDTPLEEHDFVATILETSGESSSSLPALG